MIPDEKKKTLKGQWRENNMGEVDPDGYRFKCIVRHETDAAFLVDLDGDELWVPRQACTIGKDPSGKYYVIDIKAWFAKTKRLV